MKTHVEVHNGMDIIDSRDVIARIDELESLADDAKTDGEEKQARIAELQALPLLDENTTAELEELQEWQSDATLPGKDGKPYFVSVDFGEDEHDELATLQALAEEASGSPDWRHGETLIRDSYFEEYAQELAENIGAINRDATWPNDCIDWEKAAEQLQMDYTSVEFGEMTYWIRS